MVKQLQSKAKKKLSEEMAISTHKGKEEKEMAKQLQKKNIHKTCTFIGNMTNLFLKLEKKKKV